MKITFSQLKFLFKEWRSKEFRLLALALILAVTVITMLSFYTDRINNTMNRQAAEYLGGDFVVRSPLAIPEVLTHKAAQFNCGYAETAVFPSMISKTSQLQLANIKAVSSSYPLYGHLQISDAATQKSVDAIGIPAPGTIWIDKLLLKLLAININDDVMIGQANFKVPQILTYEPDASPFGLTIAPRVLMNSIDLTKTQILQPGSQVEYQLMINGNARNIQAYKTWLKPQLKPYQKIITLRQDAAELSKTITKGDAFLHIAVLICVILAGIAIATTARYFSERQASSVALLRCFGLTHRQIISIYSFHLLLLGLISAVIGCLIGYVAQLGLAQVLSNLLSIILLPASIWPSFIGLIFGIVLLFGFAFPSLHRLKQAAPILVLRKQPLPANTTNLWLYLSASMTLILLMIWFIRDPKLIALASAGFVLTAIGLYYAAWVLLKMLTPLRQQVGISWRYGLANLTRRTASSIIQIIAFGFVFMVVLLLLIIRNDLLSAWQKQIPANAPNFFAINIAPDEVISFAHTLQMQSINMSEAYPMIKGRLITLNDQPIKQAVPLTTRKDNALKRELNLTWTNKLPATNIMVAGSWWQKSADNKPLVSMDAKLAKKFGIRLGDKLGFQIGAQQLTATVHSLRSIDWNSFQPNFFMMFPPKTLDNYPTTYLISFLLPTQQRSILADLSRQFPNVTLIDIDALLTKVHKLIDNIAMAIQYILGFTFIAGILILYATLQANKDERLYEGAILRTLGVSRRSLYISLLAEFTMLGVLSGTLAVIGATVTSTLLAELIFKIPFQVNYQLCLLSPLIGGLIIGLLGFASTYKIAKTAPVKLLRD